MLWFLWRLLLWVVIGESAVMLAKDKKLRKKIHDAEGIDKAKVLFGELVSVNKSLFSEIAKNIPEEKVAQVKEVIKKVTTKNVSTKNHWKSPKKS